MLYPNKRDNKEIYRGFVLSDAHQACEKVKMIVSRIEKIIGIDSEQSFDVRVILSELLQNAITHGKTSGDCKVYMNVMIKDNDMLNITVRDKGNGFNACEVIQEEQNRAEGKIPGLTECGRGLQIVKSLCDDIVFNRRGNCITVRKRLSYPE
ncbi:MAG TPA: ATP-binding protein [Ruminiclostridium sp.]|jgi:serine/threonine-protein kinase RsbW|nr:ATP-binding protein [Clostridiaceae bacterium]HAA25061.1 ATP-binding protein [Ruminiclostridium sp.]